MRITSLQTRHRRAVHRLAGALLFALAGIATARVAQAIEPRPWLCREIPVFSAGKRVTWRAQQSGGGQWIVTFMHYDPAGGHDGFTVVGSREVRRGAADGTLDAGQYYAVALRRAGGHWICPANAREMHTTGDGIRSLCYGADEDACDVRLTVRPADSAAAR